MRRLRGSPKKTSRQPIPQAPLTASDRLLTEDADEIFVTGRSSRERHNSLVNKTDFAEGVLGSEETPSEVTKVSGYLYKENRRGKYQKRYFTTNNSYLNYYSRRKNVKAGKVKGSVDLTKTTTICLLIRSGKATRRFAIQTSGEEDNEEQCLFLKAKTKQSAREWVDALNSRREAWKRGEPAGVTTTTITSTPQSLLNGISPKNRFPGEEEEEEDGWRDMVASDASEDTDEGFHSCEEVDSTKPKIRTTKNNNNDRDGDSYSSGSSYDEDDSDDEKPPQRLKSRTGSSSRFAIQHEALPENSKFLELPFTPWSSKFWQGIKPKDLHVRGPGYLTTKEKIPYKMDPLFECVAVDFFLTDRRVDHICAHPSNRVCQALKRGEKLPFVFAINFQVSGPPFYSLVVYLVAKHPEIVALLDPDNGDQVKLSSEFPPGMKDLLLTFFRTGDDYYCTEHFKLIPKIEEGPWMVRASIPTRPALIGRKIQNSYFRAPRYFELCVNTGTSNFVIGLVQLATSYAKLLTLDLAFLIEGKDVKELPEFILAVARVIHMDFKRAMPLPES